MNDLLQTVLTNPAARTSVALPSVMADMSDSFQPWGTVEE